MNFHATVLDEYTGMDLLTTVVKTEFFEMREKLSQQGVDRALVHAIT